MSDSGANRLLIAGTITLDTIEVGDARHTDLPGGSALYAAAAASRFSPCRVMGRAGSDFPSTTLDTLSGRGVDTAGISPERGPTFHWHARYSQDLHGREVLSREPGVGPGAPAVPSEWTHDSQIVLLGSMDPTAQAAVLAQLERPRLVSVDTMYHWIEARKQDVIGVVRQADVLFVDEQEALLLGDSSTLRDAAGVLLSLGPRIVVVKRGSRGVCMLRADGSEVERPAVGVPKVVDPTGAGDALAGGFMSVLLADVSLSESIASRALDAGIRSASLAIQDVSFNALLGAPTETGEEPFR